MAWEKSSPELVAKFDAVFPPDPRAERKLMFGYAAGFVGGNMFAGLHEQNLILRLADAARHELLKLPGAKIFEPMPGRAMREYVVTPRLVMDDEPALRKWIRRAFDYASSLPPKKAKPRTATKATKATKPAKARPKAARPARR